MEQKKIYKIYDSIMKKMLTLSGRAVINFINGLFDTDYPIDSNIMYNWTENHNDELKMTLADGIITINGRVSYHVEAQITEDEEMQFRVFDYGYRHALNVKNGTDILKFPEPVIIYLYKHGRIPDTQTLILDFGTQGIFEYKVNTFKLLTYSLEEISDKKLIILLPFMILKFRKELEKVRTKENMYALKDFILNDILTLIDENVNLGNITVVDAAALRNLLAKLYRHLYANYKEIIEEGINDMVDEGLVLEIDVIEYKHKKEMERVIQEVTEKVSEEVTDKVTNEVTKKVTEKVTDEVTKNLAKNLYKNIKDKEKVSELLNIPLNEVERFVGDI